MSTIFNAGMQFQLEPFTYPWAWDMARECEKNTWVPEQIGVGEDVATHRDPSLPASYRWVFETVMAQLTTFDIQRASDIAETLLIIVQNEEIKQFFYRLMEEERNHTRSYRYIIENLNIGTEIYTRWANEPALGNRIRRAENESTWIRSIAAGRLIDPGATLSIDNIARILRAIIFQSLIFEGIWFVMNLRGPVQALARLGHYRKAAEQFQYIARDEDHHIRFGVELIRAILREYPEVVTAGFTASIHTMVNKCVELEDSFIEYVLSQGGLVGYPIADHKETTRFIANMRLRSIDFPNLYPDVQHRFPWWSEQMEMNREKNFFETHVQEYQSSGALKWD